MVYHCYSSTGFFSYTRDLKPENILLLVDHIDHNPDERLNWNSFPIYGIRLKISDYGLGRSLDAEAASQVSQTRGVGTDGYTAPEVMEGKYDNLADIWSFAVIMHELASKEKPQARSILEYIPCSSCFYKNACALTLFCIFRISWKSLQL